jgi:selenophosphate synthetase-related protein
MAGLVGSLAMLLEWGRLGVTLDLDALPRPVHVPLPEWLTCFPAYSFLLCSPEGREAECVEAFRARGIDAAVVGIVDDSGLVAVRSGSSRAVVLDLSVTPVTGLRR